MHHTLWLTQADYNQRANCIKGLRAARSELGDALGARMTRVVPLLQEHIDTGKPVLIGRHPDLEVVRAAGVAAEQPGGCTVAIDLTPEEVFASSPENPATGTGDAHVPVAAVAAQETPASTIPLEAYRSAMVLLCINDGNPVMANATAGSLGKSTGQPEFWQYVRDAVLEVFPPMRDPLMDGDPE